MNAGGVVTHETLRDILAGIGRIAADSKRITDVEIFLRSRMARARAEAERESIETGVLEGRGTR